MLREGSWYLVFTHEVKLDLEHEDFTYYDIFMTGGKAEYMGANEVSLLIW